MITTNILVNGRPVKQYTHQGNTYIEARAGTEYSIKVRNHEWSRKLVVITVDGLNVITGQPQADDVGQGYIVNACDAIDIKGFRKDTNSVGAFKFCKKSGSYCNEKGLKGNNGVIGVRVYGEDISKNLVNFLKKFESFDSKPQKTPFMPHTISYRSAPEYKSLPDNDNTTYYKGSICNASNDTLNLSTSPSDIDIKCCMSSNTSTPDFDLGTTWGKKINDSVVYTDFEVDKTQVSEHIIYYDTRENLELIGICFKQEKQVSLPKAFGAFAQPPKGWNG